MDLTRDMWEHQVQLLTREVNRLREELEVANERMTYFENVVLTLLMGLKDAGIIEDSDEGKYTLNQFDR